MTRSCLVAAILAAALANVPVAAEAAAPPRVALVMGNAAYPGLAALPGWTASARMMADAFAKLEFDVLPANDASNGDAGAQVSSLDTKLSKRGFRESAPWG